MLGESAWAAPRPASSAMKAGTSRMRIVEPFMPRRWRCSDSRQACCPKHTLRPSFSSSNLLPPTSAATRRPSELWSPVVTTGRKHHFLLGEGAFVSGTRVHHVKYFREVCDELAMGN